MARYNRIRRSILVLRKAGAAVSGFFASLVTSPVPLADLQVLPPF